MTYHADTAADGQTTPVGEIAGIVAQLSKGVCTVLASDKFKEKGWEPNDPNSPAVNHLVELGLFTRADGRCGFEAFKASFIVPTPLCLAVRQHLQTP